TIDRRGLTQMNADNAFDLNLRSSVFICGQPFGEFSKLMSTTTASPGTLSKLVSRHEVAEGTTAFHFEKPANWTFKAGQYLDMTLTDPSETDAEGNIRSFSIASAPHEDTLMVTTRMRDTAFKRELKRMPLGAAV